MIYFENTELLLISCEFPRDLVNFVHERVDHLIMSDLDAVTETLKPSLLSGRWRRGKFDLDPSEKILQLDIDQLIAH